MRVFDFLLNYNCNFTFICIQVYTELNQFLVSEIKLEKETRKNQAQVPKVKGFDLKAEGPNVTLTKAYNNEK